MTYKEQMAVALKAEVSFGTVWRWDNGHPVRSAMAAAIKKAMAELGIEEKPYVV